MISQASTNQDTKAILFDMNGTLRQRIPDEDWQQKSAARVLELLGTPDMPISYLEELNRRYKSYTRWADENGVSLPEAEIWNRWVVPEMPRAQIEPRAVELMLALRNRNGRHILKPDALTVITALRQRKYRLGVISNTTSTVDLPRFISKWDLQDHFEVVILSSVFGVRKPDPAIFLEAARILELDPANCAYLGNKPAYDVVGPHHAGFGMAMIINPNYMIPEGGEKPDELPDRVIRGLIDLLDIFPPLTC